jgi:hypothetical protein
LARRASARSAFSRKLAVSSFIKTVKRLVFRAFKCAVFARLPFL